MSFFDILSYLNKISFIFLLITVIFFVYQIYVFKKEINFKKNKDLKIPTFQENIENKSINYTPIYELKEKKDENFNSAYFFKKKIIYLGLLIFSFFLLFYFLRQLLIDNQNYSASNNKKTENKITLTPEVTTDYYINFKNNQEESKKESSDLSLLDLTPTELITPTSFSVKQSHLISNSPIFINDNNLSDNKIEKLPISGIFDKNILVISLGLFLIFVSLLF